MARLNLDYYQGESEYSDGTMEDELLWKVKKKHLKIYMIYECILELNTPLILI